MSKSIEIEEIIGLAEVSLDQELLEEIVSRVNDIILNTLEELLGSKLLDDLKITIKMEEVNGKLVLFLDLSFMGPKIIGMDYEKAIDDAINRVATYVRERLEKYVKKHKSRGLEEDVK